MNYSSSALIATYTTNVTIRSRAVTATRALMFCSASARTLRSQGERRKRCRSTPLTPQQCFDRGGVTRVPPFPAH